VPKNDKNKSVVMMYLNFIISPFLIHMCWILSMIYIEKQPSNQPTPVVSIVCKEYYLSISCMIENRGEKEG
jgi:hypothetical protein